MIDREFHGVLGEVFDVIDHCFKHVELLVSSEPKSHLILNMDFLDVIPNLHRYFIVFVIEP